MSQKTIRILRVIARLNIGGPAIHVTLLNHHLQAPRFQSLLAAGKIESGEGDMAYLAEEMNVKVHTLEFLARSINPAGDLRSLFELYKLMKQFKPDVVHTHTAKAGFLGRVAAWLARVPVRVHTFHGHVFDGYFGKLKTHIFLTMERIAARLSDRIFTLTDSLREDISQTYGVCPIEQIQVLPLGLNLERFRESKRGVGDFRKVWNIDPESKIIGIVGRLVPIKNHELFLETAAIVAEKLPEAVFAIVGGGELMPVLRQQALELGLEEKVRFTDWQQELCPIYSDLDTLVLCSDNEGTPVSIIEALTAGCPVVSTDVGGVSELLQGGKLGRLVPRRDSSALAEAILASLEDTVTVEQRDYMRESFGIERLVGDLENIYTDLLEQKGLKV